MLPSKPTHIFHVKTSATEHQFAVNEPVLRVGSGENCAIRCSELLPHAATLVLEPSSVRVLNRSHTDIVVGSHRLSPGQQGHLKRGTYLRIDSVSITWSNPKSSKPTELPGNRTTKQIAATVTEPQTSSANSTKRQNDMVLYAILAVCVGLLVYMHVQTEEDTYATSQADFATIVMELAESTEAANNRELPRHVLQLLQRARSNERRQPIQASNDYSSVEEVSSTLNGIWPQLANAVRTFAQQRRKSLSS